MRKSLRLLYLRLFLFWGMVVGCGGIVLWIGCSPLPSLEGLPCSSDTDCGSGLLCLRKLCRQTPCTRVEVCNGKDDDCDGQIDNGTSEPPGTICSTEEVTIQPGIFTMGSPADELDRESDETAHQVTLTNKFVLWKYEVTQGEFKNLMGYNPSKFKEYGLNCPVEQVSWHEAAAFCNNLSESKGLEKCFVCTGNGSSVTCRVNPTYQGNNGQNYYTCKGYRLPTEAEWEYAYRAGTTTAFYNGNIAQIACSSIDPNLDKIGWYCGNAGGFPHAVGQKQPNSWGFYDMAGNVSEWVYDWHDRYPSSARDPVGSSVESSRVLRGGSWSDYASYLRASNRNNDSPSNRNNNVGFRPARSY